MTPAKNKRLEHIQDLLTKIQSEVTSMAVSDAYTDTCKQLDCQMYHLAIAVIISRLEKGVQTSPQDLAVLLRVTQRTVRNWYQNRFFKLMLNYDPDARELASSHKKEQFDEEIKL